MQAEHSFASTLKFPCWGSRVRTLDLSYRAPANHGLHDEVITIWRILQAARSEAALLLNSSSGSLYPDVLACVLLGFVPKRYRPAIALMGDMWEPNSGLRGAIEKVVIRLADRGIDRYVVYSTEEMDIFPRLWRVDPKKMGLCLCYYHVSDDDLAGAEPANEGHIFAGGDSGRDYGPLVEAARRFPNTRFLLATQWVSPRPLPPNVETVLAKRTGRDSHREFIRLMRTARAVVVPLQRGMKRSVGQQTYLNSMYMGKATIVVGTLGVRDHVSNGHDALIVDGTEEDYVRALEWVLAPENQACIALMAKKARAKARMFSPARTAEGLYAQVIDLLAERASSRVERGILREPRRSS
jgi:glycosyltransferase involved in cell wall biosynthesis